ncbi:MAG: hypothetical protein P4M13_07520 [Alphaproteobacteria bacterium]|nr:hypothetical protein [Alphaproteobacteria bacterium]
MPYEMRSPADNDVIKDVTELMRLFAKAARVDFRNDSPLRISSDGFIQVTEEGTTIITDQISVKENYINDLVSPWSKMVEASIRKPLENISDATKLQEGWFEEDHINEIVLRRKLCMKEILIGDAATKLWELAGEIEAHEKITNSAVEFTFIQRDDASFQITVSNNCISSALDYLQTKLADDETISEAIANSAGVSPEERPHFIAGLFAKRSLNM